MTSALEAMLRGGLLPATDFPPSSRYHGVAVKQLIGADGTATPYLARRFVPAPERFATIATQRVAEGDRLDRIAARTIGDPLQYWALCDANGAIWPQALEEAGVTIRLTLPVDVPAPGGAR